MSRTVFMVFGRIVDNATEDIMSSPYCRIVGFVSIEALHIRPNYSLLLEV